MSLCELCKGLGNWMVTNIDVNNRYRHALCWNDLQKTAEVGCPFCCHIVGYFHDRGSSVSELEHQIAGYLKGQGRQTDWITQIVQLQDLGEPTDIDISRVADNIHVLCGSTGYLDEAGMAIYVAPGDPAACPVTRLHERSHVSADPLSESTLRIVQGWINECISTHSDCFTLDGVFVPTRLIDVSTPDQDPFIVEPKDPSRYLALSHCWGKTQEVVTTTDNLPAHKVGIHFSSLSQTFKDAIHVTRKLGVQFLWIDSLCIIQDSPQDWERQSALMGNIYMDAILTIAATDAANGDQGFLSPRRSACPLPFSINHPSTGPIADNVWVAAWTPHFKDAVEQSPLSKRAWVTQERILPPRILHFTKTKLMWECRTQTEIEGRPDTRQSKLTMIWYSPSEFSQFLNNRIVSTEEFSKFMEIWHIIVGEYSQRSLTFSTDKLPALSGLAAQFQRITGDRYYAGLWEKDFPHSLCWEASMPYKRPSAYLAPSWSWASFDSGVTYPLPTNTWKSFIQFLAASSNPLGRNPLGRVSDGFLRVSALLLQVHVDLVGDNHARAFFENGEQLGSLEIECDDLPEKPWCLLIVERKEHTLKSCGFVEPEFMCSTSVLLLDRVTQDRETFRRVGILNRANPSLQWDHAERVIIEII
ncbi:hypothetical protein MMC11_001173 [Xylographa trunciseda]|nr:hypothetical protein [Xylographa trunciseda]